MLKENIKRVSIVFFLFMFVLVSASIVSASSISISASATSITVGNSATLTISGNDAIGKVNITSSNSNIVSVSSGSLWIEGSNSVRLTAKSVGTATITITPIDMATGSGNTASVGAKSITIYSKAVYVDTRSKNNYLQSLGVEGYTIDFNKETEDYALEIPYTVDSLNVNAVAEDSKSNVEISGNNELKPGENITKILVTAENGWQKEYRIKSNKAKDPKDVNADLKSIYISNATIKDEFSKDVTEYMCDDLTKETNKLLLTAEPEIEGVKVEITGNEELKFGLNHIVIKVTSKDESVTKEYNIYVYKKNEINPLIELENMTSKQKFIKWIKENKLLVLCFAVILILIIVVIILIVKNVKQRRRTYLSAPQDGSENKNRRRKHEEEEIEDIIEQEEEIKNADEDETLLNDNEIDNEDEN